jgi:FeS assembly SUF system regulator
VLRITRHTDYGVILLTHLASHPGRVYNAADLAAEAGIPPPMAGKVLQMLARGGLVDSHRGATGGYSLARPALEITVAEILTVLEGPIALTECIALGPGECDHEVGCPTRGNWERINRAVRDALAGVTLAEMVPPPVAARAVPAGMGLPVLDAGGKEV